MSKAAQLGLENPIACFDCQRDCAIKGELSSLYRAAVKPSDYDTRLYDFVRQLFECLPRLVQSKAVQDADGMALLPECSDEFLPIYQELSPMWAVRERNSKHS
jgi:hypothetical protein